MNAQHYVVIRKSDGSYLGRRGYVGGWCNAVDDAVVFPTTRNAENAANCRTPRGYSRFEQWADLRKVDTAH
ncbi:MAG: hypothetical protein HOI95_06515 [Chromatiales bacterium]|jgi:hypothetical protein|nr:hypothetical protein [Chromatiales bacterium]